MLAQFVSAQLGILQLYGVLRMLGLTVESGYVALLRRRLDARIEELKREEVRLVATRAYIIELWAEPEGE